MAGREDDRHLFGAEGYHVDIERGDRIGDDSHIDLGVENRLVNLLRRKVVELDLHLRVVHHKPLHVAAHLVKTDRIDRGDLDLFLVAAAHRSDAVENRVVRLDDLPERLVADFPFGGEAERTFRPVDQRHTDFFFEPLNGLRRRRLADLVDFGAPGKGLVKRDVAKNTEGIDFHNTAAMRSCSWVSTISARQNSPGVSPEPVR